MRWQNKLGWLKSRRGTRSDPIPDPNPSMHWTTNEDDPVCDDYLHTCTYYLLPPLFLGFGLYYVEGEAAGSAALLYNCFYVPPFFFFYSRDDCFSLSAPRPLPSIVSVRHRFKLIAWYLNKDKSGQEHPQKNARFAQVLHRDHKTRGDKEYRCVCLQNQRERLQNIIQGRRQTT